MARARSALHNNRQRSRETSLSKPKVEKYNSLIQADFSSKGKIFTTVDPHTSMTSMLNSIKIT